MFKDALDSLGTKISPNEKRDAVHVAVLPAEAAHELNPGDPVSMRLDGVVMYNPEAPIGVVDPFLKGPVFKGEWFWVMLNPRTITSLRHEWTHPGVDAEKTKSSREISEEWLRNFIAGADCPDFHTVIAEALNQENSWDDWLHFHGVDAQGPIPAEFWDHLEVYAGVKIKAEDRKEYFSCSC